MLQPTSNNPPNPKRVSLVGATSLAAQSLILNVLTVPVMAYIIRGLGASSYGQWATAASLVAATGFFSNLGLRGPFVRLVARDPAAAPNAFAEQLGSRLILSVIAGGIAIVACLALRHSLIVVECTAVAAIGMVLSGMCATVADLLQASHRLTLLAIANLIGGLVLTIASVAAIRFGRGPVGLSGAYLLGPFSAAALLILIVQLKFFPVRVRFHPRRLWELLKASRFFAAQYGVHSLGANAEPVVLPNFVPHATFGFFSAGTLLGARLAIIPDGLSTAFYPAMAAAYHDSPVRASRSVMRWITLTLVVCMPVAVLVAFIAAPIAKVLFPGQAAVCERVICITIWALPLTGVNLILGSALNAAGKDPSQAKLLSLAGAFHLFLVFLLVSRFGVWGACASWVARPVVQAAICLPCFVRTFSPRLSELPLARILACTAVMAAPMWAIAFAWPGLTLSPSGAGRAFWLSFARMVCVQGILGTVAYCGAAVLFRLVSGTDLARLFRRSTA